MTDGEKKAYRLGINNTLGLLKQTLSEMIMDENSDYCNVAIHIPNVNVITEFASIEDIVKNFND